MTLARKPACLVLPGLDGTGLLLDEFAEALGADCRVVIVRYPTDRTCDAEELFSIVASHVPADEPYSLVAESFSGPLALALAERGSPAPDALVLSASFARSPITPVAGAVTAWSATAGLAHWTPDWAIRRFLVGDAPRSKVEDFKRAISSLTPVALAGRFRALRSFEQALPRGRAACPILYLQARLDRLIGPQPLRELRERYPRLEVQVIEAPHLVFHCEPHTAAAAIARFFERI